MKVTLKRVFKATLNPAGDTSRTFRQAGAAKPADQDSKYFVLQSHVRREIQSPDSGATQAVLRVVPSAVL